MKINLKISEVFKEEERSRDNQLYKSRENRPNC